MIIPAIPPASGYETSGQARLIPRYEDITQDGRVHLASLMTGLSAVWRALSNGAEIREMMQRGVVPILSRIVMLGGEGRNDDGPFAPDIPFAVEGTWRLARETNGERIFLDMWLDASAPHMRQFGPRPAADAPRARIGRVYAEHVMTRPFAKTPAERKVTKLGVPGLPELPDHEHPHAPAAALVEGAALTVESDHLFAMMHTDSNQHVNSLVYPRLYEETATRRLLERRPVPKPEALLARAIELRYRKPFFVGDRAELALSLQPSTTDGAVHSVGAFSPPGGAEKLSTAIAMTFQ